jgi:hypothetical protein
MNQANLSQDLRKAHFHLGFEPRKGEEVKSEYVHEYIKRPFLSYDRSQAYEQKRLQLG